MCNTVKTKRMKKSAFLYFALASLFAITILSCQPDDPDDNINTDDRTKFDAAWLCTESSQMTYTVNIDIDSSNTTQIKLYNFHHLGFEEMVFGIVSGNTVTLPSQTACQGTITIEGTSSMQSNQNIIDFYYTVNDGVNLDTITAVYTKQ